MYQVYALKYGERVTTASQFFYREPSTEAVTLHFFVWLLLGGPEPVLIDTGCGPDHAAERALGAYVSPAAMVGRLGVRPGDIPVAVITHLHWDHWAGFALFPAAEFWMQRSEVAFWLGPVARHAVYKQFAVPRTLADLVALNYGDRVRMIEGEREIRPGIRARWVGGHTAGMQIVTVETARGPVVLTSDAAHFYRNVERRQPVQDRKSVV